MSSPMNNNSPIQAAPSTVSNQSEFSGPRRGPSNQINPSTGATRQFRHSQDQPTSSHANRAGRYNRGRGRPLNSKLADHKKSSGTLDEAAVDNVNDQGSSLHLGEVSVKSSAVRVKPNPRSTGGGKYRQRQQTNQLIDGMDGMDVDLVESVAPSSSGGNQQDVGKGRHATVGRKVNLTHLLNYKFDRKQRGERHRNSSFGDSSSNLRSSYSHYKDTCTTHKFNKQQFLQANCQFVVSNGHDYSVHKVDPDWPVDWKCIEEVKFRQIASTDITCPICLELPIAAKITRCGHIFCWTCMLHYLSLSDENNRPCPICSEPVYRSDLRSVISETYSNHSVDEEIKMKLMIRKKGCVEVEPLQRGQTQLTCNLSSSNDLEDRGRYFSQANLVIVDPDTVITKIALREKEELLMKLALDHDEPEVCFIEQALDRLEKRIERLRQIAGSQNQADDGSEPTNVEPSKTYLFYQSSDGQHIYLNPFSTKILCHQYGSLEDCPLYFTAKVLQMDWVSMSESWRKRFKYLEHLPLTCEFRLIEIDFENSDLVSQETYRAFEDQIRLRARERERRNKEERKRERMIRVEQNRKIYGIQPSLKINLNNDEQFPSVSDERYLGLTKSRNNDRASDEYSSSDDEHQAPPVSEPATNQEHEGVSGLVDQLEEQEPEITGVVRSFEDIQLQEAEREASAAASRGRITNSWGARCSAGATSSTFAKLLVDAKASQKEWTRIPSSSNTNQASSLSSNWPGLCSSSVAANSDDDGGVELRAPTSEFTISDFLDMTTVTGTGRRRTKTSKSTGRKG